MSVAVRFRFLPSTVTPTGSLGAPHHPPGPSGLPVPTVGRSFNAGGLSVGEHTIVVERTRLNALKCDCEIMFICFLGFGGLGIT